MKILLALLIGLSLYGSPFKTIEGKMEMAKQMLPENDYITKEEFEILEKTDNKLFALYKKGEGYLGNRRDFYIELFFSKEGKLLKNKKYLAVMGVCLYIQQRV